MSKYAYTINQMERVEELIYKYKQPESGVIRYMVRANKERIHVRNTFATLEEARTFTENFENMVNEKEYDEEELGEALAFDEIYKQESRKTCATLPYKGLIKIINED